MNTLFLSDFNQLSTESSYSEKFVDGSMLTSNVGVHFLTLHCEKGTYLTLKLSLHIATLVTLVTCQVSFVLVAAATCCTQVLVCEALCVAFYY